MAEPDDLEAITRLMVHWATDQARIEPDPAIQGRIEQWTQAFATWLAEAQENTRRAYVQAWVHLLQSVRHAPWDIDRDQIKRWIQQLAREDRSPATINLYVSGISSFYNYVAKRYMLSPATKQMQALIERNPTDGVERPELPQQPASCLTLDQTRSFLGAIPRDTPQGLRDFALFSLLLTTGRKASAVVRLRWRDFRTEPKFVRCRWTSAQGKEHWDTLPVQIWENITTYLRAAGRLGDMAPENPIFTPLSDSATHFPTTDQATWSRNRPLSSRRVGDLARRYAQHAGIQPDQVSPQALTYTALHLRDKLESDQTAAEMARLLLDRLPAPGRRAPAKRQYSEDIQDLSVADWLGEEEP